MRIEQAVPTSEMKAGHLTVSQAVLPLTSLAFNFTYGVWVKAAQANGGFVYVGDAGVSSTNGYELDSSEYVFLPVNDPSKIYVIASADNQAVSWIGA